MKQYLSEKIFEIIFHNLMPNSIENKIEIIIEIIRIKSGCFWSHRKWTFFSKITLRVKNFSSEFNCELDRWISFLLVAASYNILKNSPSAVWPTSWSRTSWAVWIWSRTRWSWSPWPWSTSRTWTWSRIRWTPWRTWAIIKKI